MVLVHERGEKKGVRRGRLRKSQDRLCVRDAALTREYKKQQSQAPDFFLLRLTKIFSSFLEASKARDSPLSGLGPDARCERIFGVSSFGLFCDFKRSRLRDLKRDKVGLEG